MRSDLAKPFSCAKGELMLSSGEVNVWMLNNNKILSFTAQVAPLYYTH